jgi:hypothetical protein
MTVNRVTRLSIGLFLKDNCIFEKIMFREMATFWATIYSSIFFVILACIGSFKEWFNVGILWFVVRFVLSK